MVLKLTKMVSSPTTNSQDKTTTCCPGEPPIHHINRSGLFFSGESSGRAAALPVRVKTQVVRLEVSLVIHRRYLLDEVAEIEVFDVVLQAEVDHGENVESSQAAPSLIRIKVEVDCVHPVLTDIDDPVADQSLTEAVADLHGGGDGVDKKTGIVGVGPVGLLRITGLKEPVAEFNVFLAHGGFTELDHEITIFFQCPSLVTVVCHFPRVEPDGNTLLAVRTVHSIEAVTVSAIARCQKKLHGPVTKRCEQCLIKDRIMGQGVGALHRHLDKILLDRGFQLGELPGALFIVKRHGNKGIRSKV